MASYHNPIKKLKSGVSVQTQLYIQSEKCTHPGCDVWLFWYDNGEEDAGECFRTMIKDCSCECPEPVYCCTTHVKNEDNTIICEECNESLELPDETNDKHLHY